MTSTSLPSLAYAPDRDAGRGREISRAAGIGAVAGLAGGGAMVVSEKVEQLLTGRTDSFVPGRTLLALLGQAPAETRRDTGSAMVMHYASAAAVGAVRGVWAATGIRGAHADVWHTILRLGVDQTLENASGAGAPPTSWPVRERLVDTGHKLVYSVVTGVLADLVIRPTLAPRMRHPDAG